MHKQQCNTYCGQSGNNNYNSQLLTVNYSVTLIKSAQVSDVGYSYQRESSYAGIQMV